MALPTRAPTDPMVPASSPPPPGPPGRASSGRAFLAWSLALLVAARLPWLLSPNRVLDGDEAILGLMASHLARGEPPSLFFQGQAYGLSIFEAAPAAAAFLAFGAGPVVLSLTMLALFLAGLLAWERALGRIARDPTWGRALALMLGLLPVWIVWSMKARGGYLTAFVGTGCALALLTGSGAGATYSRRRAGGVGALLGVVTQAQPLWTPALLPFLLLPRLRGAPWSRVAISAVSAAAAAVGLGVAGGQGSGDWEPAVLLGFSLGDGLIIPERLYRAFTGFFLLGDVFPAPLPVAIVAGAAAAAFLASLIWLAVDALRRRTAMSAVAGLALAWALVPVLALRDAPPRYLLQTAAWMPVGVAALVGAGGLGSWRLRRPVAVAAAIALLVAAFQVRDLRTHARSTTSDVEAQLRDLGRTLEANGVEGAFAVDGLLQWQLLFYMGESVPVRSRRAHDRFPEYGRAVDARFRAGGRTVLVGPMHHAPRPDMAAAVANVHLVGTDYFVVDGVDERVLRALGFDLEPGAGGG